MKRIEQYLNKLWLYWRFNELLEKWNSLKTESLYTVISFRWHQEPLKIVMYPDLDLL